VVGDMIEDDGRARGGAVREERNDAVAGLVFVICRFELWLHGLNWMELDLWCDSCEADLVVLGCC
jgi:hypothetical protein